MGGEGGKWESWDVWGISFSSPLPPGDKTLICNTIAALKLTVSMDGWMLMYLPACTDELCLLFTTEHACDVPGAMMAGEKCQQC